MTKANGLSKLLQIKKTREDLACIQLNLRKRELSEAREAESKKKKECTDYRAFRTVEEMRQFEELKRQALVPRELNKYKHRVFKLREREAALEKEYDAAQKLRGKAETAEEAARQKYFKAFKNRLKIEEINKIQSMKARIEENRKLEKELDDIPARPGRQRTRDQAGHAHGADLSCQ